MKTHYTRALLIIPIDVSISIVSYLHAEKKSAPEKRVAKVIERRASKCAFENINLNDVAGAKSGVQMTVCVSSNENAPKIW